MPDQHVDPKLKSIAAAIAKMCKKADVGLSLTLVSKTHTEYLNYFPSWSAAQPIPSDNGPIGIQLRVKEAEVGREKARQLTEDTASLLCSMRDVAINNFTMYQYIIDQASSAWRIDHEYNFSRETLDMLLALIEAIANIDEDNET